MEIKNRKLLGYQFHRQVPMLDFIVDFYCHELMLAIEVDGDSHSADEAKDYDLKRQQRLEAYGVHFIRFEDLQIKRNIDQAVGNYKELVNRTGVHPPCPPLKGGRFNLDRLLDYSCK